MTRPVPLPPEVARELERLASSIEELSRAYPEHADPLRVAAQALLSAARAGRVAGL